MQALWTIGPATVRAVQDAMARPLAYTTVLTLLRILEQKGYVHHSPSPKSSRAYLYAPAVSRDRVQKQHVRDLVSRFFGGRTPELMAGLIDDEPLSADELEALRTKINERLRRSRKGRSRS